MRVYPWKGESYVHTLCVVIIMIACLCSYVVRVRWVGGVGGGLREGLVPILGKGRV